MADKGVKGAIYRCQDDKRGEREFVLSQIRGSATVGTRPSIPQIWGKTGGKNGEIHHKYAIFIACCEKISRYQDALPLPKSLRERNANTMIITITACSNAFQWFLSRLHAFGGQDSNSHSNLDSLQIVTPVWIGKSSRPSPIPRINRLFSRQRLLSSSTLAFIAPSGSMT